MKKLLFSIGLILVASVSFAEEKQVFINENVKCNIDGEIVEYTFPFKLLEFASVLNDEGFIIKDENGNVVVSYPSNCWIRWYETKSFNVPN